MYDSLNGEPVHLFPQYYFQDKPDMPIYSCNGTGKSYVSALWSAYPKSFFHYSQSIHKNILTQDYSFINTI